MDDFKLVLVLALLGGGIYLFTAQTFFPAQYEEWKTEWKADVAEVLAPAFPAAPEDELVCPPPPEVLTLEEYLRRFPEAAK